MQLALMRKRLLIFLLFAFVATVILSPLSSNTAIPSILDYINHMTAIGQARIAMEQGQFPLRVMPLQNSGMGYPYFQFYSPTSHWFAAIIYRWITPSNPYIAYKITIWLALLFGGIYMYRLASWFVHSVPAALLASVAYLTSPYYIIVVDQLGGFNEAIALGILPSVLLYSIKCYQFPEEKKYFLQTSLTWYLLATIHIITFFYTSFFAAALLIFVTLKKSKHVFNLLNVGLAYAFAWLLGMWYFAPIMLVKKYMYLNSVFHRSDIFGSYHTAFATLISPMQNYVKELPGKNGLIDSVMQFEPNVGAPLLFGIGVCLYVILSRQKIDNKLPVFWLVPLLSLFMIAFVMVWSPFNFWHMLPGIFVIGQYSWRILGQVSWIAAILFAWALVWLFKNELDNRHIILGLFMLILSTSGWFEMHKGAMTEIPIAEIAKNPVLVWNPDTFQMDAQRSKQIINLYDNKLIDLTAISNQLEINTAYYFPVKIIKNAATPFFELEGSIVNDAKLKNKNIEILINNNKVTQVEFKPGDFKWIVSLASLKKEKEDANFSLTLKMAGAPNAMKLDVTKMLFGGLIDPAMLITLDQINPHCQHKKALTVCEIEANSSIKFIELPQLYFPQLIKITLNGKAVPYISILNQKNLLAAIEPIVGMNVIKMQFSGLAWANGMSFFAWIVWAILLIWMIVETSVIRLIHERILKNEK